MKVTILIIVGIFVAMSFVSMAEDTLDAKTINLVIKEPYRKAEDSEISIDVTGIGKAEAKVDHVTVFIYINIIDKTDQVKAKQQSDLDVKRIIKAALNHGISDKDIDGTYISIGPYHEYSEKKRKSIVVGYQAVRKLNLRLRDLTKLDELLADIVKINSAQIQGLKFGSELLEKAKNKSLHSAVSNARKQANEIANAFDMKVGKVLEINRSQRYPKIAVKMVEVSLNEEHDLPDSSFIKKTLPALSKVEVRFELIRKEK